MEPARGKGTNAFWNDAGAQLLGLAGLAVLVALAVAGFLFVTVCL